MSEVYACECGHAPPHSHDPKVYEGVKTVVPLACGHFHSRPLKIHDVSFEVCTTCARCYRAEVTYDEQC